MEILLGGHNLPRLRLLRLKAKQERLIFSHTVEEVGGSGNPMVVEEK